MKKRYLYFISFIIPLIIVSIAWYFVGFYPFGDKTIMAIDFGNQYIDLFAFMRQSVLSGDWSALFHSFSKSIGGSTVGIWAYYLMSPFNILYLFFPKEYIAIPATLTVFLRYGFMSLAMAHYLNQRKAKSNQDRNYIPIFSTIYALSGFTVSYQMNPLFMDALIILPLIILYLEELLDGESVHKYVALLCVAIITQFYTAFMIAILIVLYSLYYLITNYWTTSVKESIRITVRKFTRMVLYSLFAAGIIAVFIFPVLYNLLESKGELQTGMQFELKLQMNPLEIFSKFFIGAFDNKSWSAGPNLPNIYVGSLPLIGLIFYYFSKEITLREKLASFFIFLVFFISIIHKFTNQLWHMGQSPAGFFYRFTFLIIFMIIILAYKYFVEDGKVSYLHMFLGSSFMLLVLSLVFPQDHSFLEDYQLQVTVMFFALVIIALVVKSQYKWLFIGIFVFTELGWNIQIIQSRLNYTNEATFRDAIQITDQVMSEIRPDSTELYRIHNLFYRSKNDPFMQNYPGFTNFSSNLENATRTFIDSIGSNGINAATTYNGSLITDALLGIRYYVDDKDMVSEEVDSSRDYIFRNDFIRDDIEYNLPIIHEDRRFQVYDNKDFIGMGYLVGEDMIDLQLTEDKPFKNHELIGQALHQSNQAYLTQIQPNVVYNGFLVVNDTENKMIIKKEETLERASIKLTFTPKNNHSYYIQIPETLKYKESNGNSYQLNGLRFPLINNFNVPQLVNITSNQEGVEQTFEIISGEVNNIDISELKVVELNDELVSEAVEVLRSNPFEINYWRNNYIEGEINVPGETSQYLMTSIPFDKGWSAKIDGKKVDPEKVLDTFLALQVDPGQHKIILEFIPPGLWIGLLVSGIFILLYYLMTKYAKQKQYD